MSHGDDCGSMGARWRDEPVNKHKDRGRKAFQVQHGALKTHPGAEPREGWKWSFPTL